MNSSVSKTSMILACEVKYSSIVIATNSPSLLRFNILHSMFTTPTCFPRIAVLFFFPNIASPNTISGVRSVFTKAEGFQIPCVRGWLLAVERKLEFLHIYCFKKCTYSGTSTENRLFTSYSVAFALTIPSFFSCDFLEVNFRLHLLYFLPPSRKTFTISSRARCTPW